MKGRVVLVQVIGIAVVDKRSAPLEEPLGKIIEPIIDHENLQRDEPAMPKVIIDQ